MESTTQMLVLEDDSSSGMVAVLSCVNTFYDVFTYHHKNPCFLRRIVGVSQILGKMIIFRRI